MDPIVLLTPLLVLAVVLLLGFAGCERIANLEEVTVPEPDPPPPPPPMLTLRVRVPQALVVQELTFLWDPPSTVGSMKTRLKPTPDGIDAGDNIFDWELSGEPDYGAWTATCTLRVREGRQAGATATGNFNLDGSLQIPIATFVASGEPLTLAVAFDNVYEGA